MPAYHLFSRAILPNTQIGSDPAQSGRRSRSPDGASALVWKNGCSIRAERSGLAHLPHEAGEPADLLAVERAGVIGVNEVEERLGERPPTISLLVGRNRQS